MKRLDFIGLTFSMSAIAFCVFGLSTFQSDTEDVLQWLPDKSQAREQYDFFEKRFGGDDFLIATWAGCSVDDDRLKQFSQYIRDNDPQHLVRTMVSGVDILDQLGRELGLSRKSIARRMKGVFFGIDDPDLTCALIELSHEGTKKRILSMQLVWDAIENVPDLDRDDVRLGGYPYIATHIDDQLKNSFRNFLGPSILLATLVSLICLRNLVLTSIIFVAAVGAAAVSIAWVPVCGAKFGGLMSIIPALVFVLTTSGSIHLIRYSLDAIGDVRMLLMTGWKPCAISAATTAVGMLSLTRSSFPAIRNFGFFCAVGVGTGLAFQLVIVPWLLNRFGQNGLRKLALRSDTSTYWQNLIERIQRRKYLISIVSISLMGFSVIGVTKLAAEVEVEKLFRPDSEIIVSLVDMEKRLFPMDQTELLVVFDGVDSEHFPDRVHLISQIQRALAKVPEIGITYSLVNFLPVEPKQTNMRSYAKRKMYRTGLRQERDNLAKNNLLDVNENIETWRISLRFPFTRKNDFGKLAQDVVGVSSSVVNELSAETTQTKPRLIYTGKTHLFHHAQLTLLADLFQNFLLAFLIITPILIFVLRSFSLGLIAMLPNLFPILVVFGGFGWTGFPVDLAIAMTACIALGIAVDDTTHFLIRFRDHGGSLNNTIGPVKQTIKQCGPAMLHTTMIGSAGLIVYYYSDLLVVSRFSWVITLLLIIALLADVIMLPAILFLFARSKRDPASSR